MLDITTTTTGAQRQTHTRTHARAHSTYISNSYSLNSIVVDSMIRIFGWSRERERGEVGKGRGKEEREKEG